MECVKAGDEGLEADKMDLLYGEADAEVRGRVEAHLRDCTACREEMAALQALRRDLQAWSLPRPRPTFTPGGLFVPRWLAAAAALLVAGSATLGAAGYREARRAAVAQEATARALAETQRAAAEALAAARATPRLADAGDLLARVDERIEARLARLGSEQDAQLEARLARWNERTEAQRRLDLARMAASLSYLDGQHGQQLARTNEVMGYVLQQASDRRPTP